MNGKPLFDPDNLGPDSLIGRIKIADLPVSELEEAVRGSYVFYLLQAGVIAGLVRQNLTALPLTGNQSEDLLAWDGAFCSGEEQVRQQARQVAGIAGRRLGYVLATLKRGDEASRQSRPDWQARHWEFWAGIKEVWLGGGLVSGQAGPYIIEAAGEVLDAAGAGGLEIRLSPYPARLPLIGMARSLNPASPVALVFDFGQSWIKSALAFYRDGALTGLEMLEPRPSATFMNFDKDGELYRAALEAVASAWQTARRRYGELNPEMGLSIARFVQDGRPYNASGPVEYDFRGELAGDIARQVQQPVRLQIRHDASAAARCHAGRENAAVIMLGTYLGLGFPPALAGLCPLAPGFNIKG